MKAVNYIFIIASLFTFLQAINVGGFNKDLLKSNIKAWIIKILCREFLLILAYFYIKIEFQSDALSSVLTMIKF